MSLPRMWSWLLGLWAGVVLVGCGAPPPPAAAPGSPPPPPLPTATVRRSVEATWSFRHDAAACLAAAQHPALTLSITVGKDGQVAIALRPGPALQPAGRRNTVVPVAFAGETVAWRERGRLGPSGAVILSQPLDEVAASRVLQLLAGGTVEVGGIRPGWPLLQLPAAGAAGRDWFECVRRRLFS